MTKKLEARENSMRQFEELSNLGSWEINLHTKMTLWSQQTYDIYGEEASKFKYNGIDVYPQNALNSHDLIRYADSAIYEANDEGAETTSSFTLQI
ncbi:MAG: hypothetical protein PHU40_09225 [Sulfurimonas sp.]|nr:hypothetical protein [Sulfurimonas sp.]